ncbi:MAG TPA: SRPBCC domain-containing protein [Solirubrobacteraceae bacterium]|jgi:uncharacterized protein YndB with AHSA1/START domain|nr:SRPBCC domain-containing protein [Solirubrobacteraceae bacterium]
MSAPDAGRQASEVAAFRTERTFAAAPEEVFDAWTSPDVLERWWGRPSWSPLSFAVDLRVGGGYSLRMLDEDGKPYAVAGEYREIERPHRLVYTWCWEDGGPDPGHVSLVTVEFHTDGSSTTVVLEHSGLPSELSRSGHGDGWGGALENLARQVFTEST